MLYAWVFLVSYTKPRFLKNLVVGTINFSTIDLLYNGVAVF
jgi:hypothetical protein